MDNRLTHLISRWQKRNISGFVCPDKKRAQELLLRLIPQSASVGVSGSQTLQQLEVIETLGARGNRVFDPAKAKDKEESLRTRRQGTQADYYLASPNAIAETGELVFFSAYGNRIAGVTYADKAVIIAGINKLAPTLEEALKRARELATPLNCKRLQWNTPCLADGKCKQEICSYPDYKRMCCQVLIVEAEALENRMSVILVEEGLGF